MKFWFYYLCFWICAVCAFVSVDYLVAFLWCFNLVIYGGLMWLSLVHDSLDYELKRLDDIEQEENEIFYRRYGVRLEG